MNKLDDYCVSLIHQFIGFENKKVFKKVLKELKIVQKKRLEKEFEYIKNNRYIIYNKFERKKYITTLHVSRYSKKEKIREFYECEVKDRGDLMLCFGYKRPHDISRDLIEFKKIYKIDI